MNLSRRIEDYLIVTLITLLIWFYAESRTLDTYEYGPQELRLKLADPDLVALDRSLGRVELSFTGARSSISQVRSLLANGLEINVDKIDPDIEEVETAALVMMDKRFVNTNANIDRATPERLKIRVARLVEAEADLAWKPNEIKLLDDAYEISPPTVKLRLPQEQLDDLTASGKLTLDVRPKDDPRMLAANVPWKLKWPVRLPPILEGVPGVEVTPGEVTVSFVIERKDQTHTLASVPVFVAVPPNEMRNFAVTIHEDDRLLKDVKLTGPADVLERVKSGAVAVKAEVLLTHDELTNAAKKNEPATFPVRLVDVPQGLTVENPKATIRATITRVER